ncbi:MAG TPA: tail fiber protein [Thermoanaerobaculia bacterium]
MAYPGEIRLFAGSYVPQGGWAQCDGSLLEIASYEQLASVLGSTYGGDGRTTFRLPDLGTNAPLHRSSVIPLGKSGSGPLSTNPQPAPLLYLIATTTPSTDLPFVGEIRTFAFGAIPRNWALCDGSILQIESNTALFSVIENAYGGNSAQGTFALPDLRANTLDPASGNDPLGYVVMSYCIATAGEYLGKS